MSFFIRDARTEDMSQILNLIKELAIYENEPEAVSISLNELKSDFINGNFQCFVAVEENYVVGMALFYNRYSTWKGKTIHLEDLIVTETHRQKGIGKALLDKLVELAKRENLRRVEWNVLDWNTPAIEFYKSVGANILKDWYLAQLDENGIKQY